MVELGPGQKPMVMPHYPHMLAEDIEVWTKFLHSAECRVERVWYDVHVGGGVLLPAGATDLERRVALGVTRKRIDVVCRVKGGYWVVEVKPYANMTALGQAISYTRLFKQEYKAIGKIQPTVVCDNVDEDLIDDFRTMGVQVICNE